MPEAALKWFVASCAACVTIVLLFAAMVLLPVAGREPDWAGIYTMRWSALTAVFTGVSAFAIAASAIYARQAIALAQRTQRIRHTLKVLAAYRRDGVEAAFHRCANAPTTVTYTPPDRLRDASRVIYYFEDVALQLETGIVETDLVLRHFRAPLLQAWEVLFRAEEHAVALPHGPGDFPQFARLVTRARAWGDAGR